MDCHAIRSLINPERAWQELESRRFYALPIFSDLKSVWCTWRAQPTFREKLHFSYVTASLASRSLNESCKQLTRKVNFFNPYRSWLVTTKNQAKLSALEWIYPSQNKLASALNHSFANFFWRFDRLSSTPSNEFHQLGVCFGASMWFLSLYLHRNPTLQKQEQVCKQIAGELSRGGSSAVLAIHMMQTLRRTRLSVFLRISSALLAGICFLAASTLVICKHLIKSIRGEVMRDKSMSCLGEIFIHRIISVQRTLQKMVKISGWLNLAVVNFSTCQTPVFSSQRMKGSDLPSLSSGCYFVQGESQLNFQGHAMAYVKSSENLGYLFDPNFGLRVLRGDQSQELAKYFHDKFYIGLNFFIFTKLQKRHSYHFLNENFLITAQKIKSTLGEVLLAPYLNI